MYDERLEFPTEGQPIKLDFTVETRVATIRDAQAQGIVLTKERPGAALFLVVDYLHKVAYLTPVLGKVRGFEEVVSTFMNGQILKT